MSEAKQLILGEFSRKLGERFRLTLPGEFGDVFKPEAGKCVLAKERPGCLSLWEENVWKANLDGRIELIRQRMKLGDLNQKKTELQMFGRLLSTRHKDVQLDEKARFTLPDGFREFLAVELGKEVMVVGAAVCIEIWHPEKWLQYLEGEIPEFQNLLDKLSH